MRQDNYFEAKPFEVYPEVDAYEVFDAGLTGGTRTGEVNRKNRRYIRWVQQSLNRIMGLRLPVDGTWDRRHVAPSALSSGARDWQ